MRCDNIRNRLDELWEGEATAEVRQHLTIGGETPLLMMDDVLSELDRDRRAGLIQLLSDELAVEQTLITSTENPGITRDIPIAQVLQASAGQLTVVPEPYREPGEWRG